MAEPQELKILDGLKSIFDKGDSYVIPLYQRAFAWEDKQLGQLVDDIAGIEGNDYYIGSLITYRYENEYEVIDGQQRLTALFLLLNCLGIVPQNSLHFKLRPKSEKSLLDIRKIIDGGLEWSSEDYDAGILGGALILKEKLKNLNIPEEKLKENLQRVIIYRIEVPPFTDLNRYFEIMNIRGEQLEQHDILKARLMDLCRDCMHTFATIWDACSDMNGYVQMHFSTKGNLDRSNVFGSNWQNEPHIEWTYDQAVENNDETKKTIADIIKSNFKVDNVDGKDEEDLDVRFESVIDFPHFLLHSLKIYVKQYNVQSNDGSRLVEDLLDENKLLYSFDSVLKNGFVGKEKLDGKIFAQQFVECMLKTRFLFDKFIIKREFEGDSKDGAWSLKELVESKNKKQKTSTPAYRYTSLIGTATDQNVKYARQCIMLQAALRVSYTSPKGMHWITKVLDYFTFSNENASQTLLEFLEDFAKKEVKSKFLDVCSKNNEYKMGLNTPHIVFNYLDYALWKEDYLKTGHKYEFDFEFRTSIEHWYPQNPEEGKWENKDCFGNLCLIQRNVNSKFSNKHPTSKKNDHKEMIAKGSLKLRLMSKLTTSDDNWRETACINHEKEMIAILKRECGTIANEEPSALNETILESSDSSEATLQPSSILEIAENYFFEKRKKHYKFDPLNTGWGCVCLEKTNNYDYTFCYRNDKKNGFEVKLHFFANCNSIKLKLIKKEFPSFTYDKDTRENLRINFWKYVPGTNQNNGHLICNGITASKFKAWLDSAYSEMEKFRKNVHDEIYQKHLKPLDLSGIISTV